MQFSYNKGEKPAIEGINLNINPSEKIAIIGSIGSGKSTASNIVKKYDYEEITFANPVKEIGLILGFEHNELYGTQEDKLKLKHLKYDILQTNLSVLDIIQKYNLKQLTKLLLKII